MKIYLFLVSLSILMFNSFSMNPGCIRQNSDGIRSTLFLMHLSNGEVQLALDLLDVETYTSVSKESLNDTFKEAKNKYTTDFGPISQRLEQLNKQKCDLPPQSKISD